MEPILSLRELRRLLTDPAQAEGCSVANAGSSPFLIVNLADGARGRESRLIQPACTVIGLARAHDLPVPNVVDVLATSPEALAGLCAAVRANPVAASVLAQVVRHNARASVTQGLLVESLAYSTLQHGAEFEGWLARRPIRPAGAEVITEPLRIERQAQCLRLTFDRPAKRNAFSAALRDALCAGLELADYDASVREIVIDGAGPAFCAGGDLDEFGDARDAAIAHATRMTRSAGALLYRLRNRVTCHVHGACIGAGIELPAFTRRIRARPDAFFQLPEVSMGLVPGAGGTVSITKRIGRLRSAALAISGERVDASTALRWGLIDAIVERFD